MVQCVPLQTTQIHTAFEMYIISDHVFFSVNCPQDIRDIDVYCVHLFLMFLNRCALMVW